MNQLLDYKKVTKINSIFMVILLASIATSMWTSKLINRSNENRLISLGLAQELQQSSNDLTKYARLYVVTRDVLWEERYDHLVKVRAGLIPRDDGKTIALNDLFKKQGFTDQEFEKLKSSNDLSSSLVETEVEAMNIVKGLYKDENGKYTKKLEPDYERARTLMHDKNYNDSLVKIAEPVNEFNTMLKTRLNSEVENNVTKIFYAQIITIILALLIYALSNYGTSSLKKILAEAIRHLSTSSEKIREVMNSLQATGETLSSLSTESAAAVSETVAAVDETNAMINNNKELAISTASTTHKSRDNANIGRNVVHKMSVLMGEINSVNEDVANTVSHSNERFGEIVSMINEISNKTKVINDIVFQTRLLSFNASVEAARAGDQGKGFAVVAEEVGNLAQASGKSANEISMILEENVQKVQSIVNETRSAMEKIIFTAKSKTHEGTEIAKECSLVLEKIVNEVGEVVEMSEKITSASSEQAHGMGEIAKAMGNIDQSTHETNHLSKKVSQISDELSTEVQAIANMIGELEKLTA